MTHPNTKKLYEVRFWMSVFRVLSLDRAAVPAPSFNRFSNYFFLMRCHAGRTPIVNWVKIRGHKPPPRVGWEQKINTKAGGEEGGKGRRVNPPPSLWRGVSKKM